MKLLMAIVRNDCAGDVVASLAESNFGVTRISTTGGIWRRGNATLLIGIEEQDIDKVLAIIDAKAGPSIEPDATQGPYAPHRATVFVLGVDSFQHY
jgi:uncharacterized protein YaaQ